MAGGGFDSNSFFRSPEFRISMLELIIKELLDRIDTLTAKFTELSKELEDERHNRKCNPSW